jgi:hypothetical protein
VNTDIAVINIVLISTDESVTSSLAARPICDAILAFAKTLKRFSKSLWNDSFRIVRTINSCNRIKNIQASFFVFLCCSMSYHFGFSPLVIAEFKNKFRAEAYTDAVSISTTLDESIEAERESVE